jgi:hypothetical protein
MTRAEFYAKYGDIKVKFSSYYKYTFTYRAALPDGKTLTCDYGGNNDQIYRHTAVPDAEETVSNLQPYAGIIYDNGAEVESFYDY